VISYHQAQIWYDSKVVLSCQNQRSKHLNFNYIYPISYKIAKKANPVKWIQKVAGKGWFSLLRLYDPVEAWYDKTWRPGEIELID
jgi:hypothetical protein